MRDRGARYTPRKAAGKKAAALVVALVVLSLVGAGVRAMLRSTGGGRS